jgi:hypothetical protein
LPLGIIIEGGAKPFARSNLRQQFVQRFLPCVSDFLFTSTVKALASNSRAVRFFKWVGDFIESVHHLINLARELLQLE